jgi:hypothetical protein
LFGEPFAQGHQENGDPGVDFNIQWCDGVVSLIFILSTKDRVNGGGGKSHPHVADPGAKPFGLMQLVE